jgi:hypothetical protein
MPLSDWFVWAPQPSDAAAAGASLTGLGGRFGHARYTRRDLEWMLGFACLLFVLRQVLARLVFLPLGRRLVGTHRPLFLRKWEENCWYVVYYASSTALGLAAMRDKLFFANPVFYFTDFPTDAHRDALFRLYYAVGAGFYLQTLVALVAFETKRKDFLVMIVHHVVTVVLMAVSWLTGNERIGGVVLLLHDAVDIFLYATKAAHYCGARLEPLTNALFALFALVYFLLRMAFFLARVILYAAFAPAYSRAMTYVAAHRPDAAPGAFYVSEAGICAHRYCISPHWFLTALMAVLLRAFVPVHLYIYLDTHTHTHIYIYISLSITRIRLHALMHLSTARARSSHACPTHTHKTKNTTNNQ